LAARSVDYLLIGGGMAAANCARWLREEGLAEANVLLGRQRGHALAGVELHHACPCEELDRLLFPPLVGAE